MSALAQLVALNSDNTTITIGSGSWDTVWNVSIRRRVEGICLEVDANGKDPEAAIYEALNKWHKALGQGIPELQPALTYEPASDEIPY